MAITKTEKVTNYDIRMSDGEDATLYIQSITTWDDPDDNDLPMTKGTSRNLTKTTTTVTYNETTGERTESKAATDISGESKMIQDICAIIWA